MKIKINWGTGIVIALVVMMSGMSFLVYLATRQDYSLVEKDYYQKEIVYQEQIDKINNASALKDKILCTQTDKGLQVTFPDVFKTDSPQGTIHLYSLVSSKNDVTVPIKLNGQLSQLVSVNHLPKGRYKVKVDWIAKETPYYEELEIFLK